jgi:hypothetical protein
MAPPKLNPKATIKPAGISKPVAHGRLTRKTSGETNHKFLEIADSPKVFPAFRVREFDEV